ncbi:F-box protein At3g07870-like [Hibiscus syriacus]|uniref:F-box protein At3g07870-like n=1 Tax=Hibiscus syriacus TaxID=106335 RepID=UPI001924BFBE|nr:F-box protein At3g07870-like [Hibiscus syriacus]
MEEKSTMKEMRKGQPEANMTDRLPREIIVNILSLLPLTSLLNSKLVCRAWRTLIQDPFLIRKHLDEAAGNDPSFVLESIRTIPDQRYFIDFFDHSEGKMISKKLPGFPTTMHLVDSCDGLLCLHDTSRTVFICNPFTRVYVKLRKPVKCPTVVGHLWFHWLSRPNKYTKASLLISFDLETEQFQEVTKADCCCASDMCFRQLTVVRGCPSAGAFHGDDERSEIWVIKEYGVKESWIKEFTIGTYLPPTLIAQREIRQLRYSNPNLLVQVLCVLKSGEILLEFLSSALVLYDPQYETFKELGFWKCVIASK